MDTPGHRTGEYISESFADASLQWIQPDTEQANISLKALLMLHYNGYSRAQNRRIYYISESFAGADAVAYGNLLFYLTSSENWFIFGSVLVT